MHGGNAPLVRAAREARVAAAAAFQAAPQSTRDAGEILVPTMQDGDTIYRYLFDRFRNGTETEADWAAMGAWLDRSNRLAKSVHDAGIDERRMKFTEDQGCIMAGVIQRVADALLVLVIGQVDDERTRAGIKQAWAPAMRAAVKTELLAELEGPR